MAGRAGDLGEVLVPGSAVEGDVDLSPGDEQIVGVRHRILTLAQAGPQPIPESPDHNHRMAVALTLHADTERNASTFAVSRISGVSAR